VNVGVFVGVFVGVCVAVAVGVLVGVLVAVAVGVFVGVLVGVFVAVEVGVCVGFTVAVAVGVGGPLKWHSVTVTLSTRQPSPEPLSSLAILQRILPFTTRLGRFTIVRMKPPELPLQAWRPAMGLPVPVEIVEL